MAVTMQTIINAARVPLNDPNAVAWKDADDLLVYARHGLQLLRGKRPDLFFGQFSGGTALSDLALDGDCPIDEEFHPALIDYITARAFFKEDELAVQGAAAPFYALFVGNIT